MPFLTRLQHGNSSSEKPFDLRSKGTLNGAEHKVGRGFNCEPISNDGGFWLGAGGRVGSQHNFVQSIIFVSGN